MAHWIIPIEIIRQMNEDLDNFIQWWQTSKNEFPWEQRGSWELVHSTWPAFEVWWDKDKFVYDLPTCIGLARNCSDHFNIWWDEKQFVYSWGAFNYLAMNCNSHFHKWWNNDMLSALYGDEEAFWDQQFDQSICNNLANYCKKYFRKWFDPKTFNWKECGHRLKEEFQEHKDLWEPHYVENRI